MTEEQLTLFDPDEYTVKPKQIKIALLGQMRAGKDTVADLLQEYAEFETFRFAQGIQEIIEFYFPEVSGTKPRQHYQVIGQSLRQLNPDVWVDTLHRSMSYRVAKFNKLNLLITDVRQQNEVDYCRKNGYIIIKVVADEADRLQRIKAAGDTFEPEQLQHETELGIEEMYCDLLIDNSGTWEELDDKVKHIMQTITGKTYEEEQ